MCTVPRPGERSDCKAGDRERSEPACGARWSNSEPGGDGERSDPDCRASAERPQGGGAGGAASPACGAQWSNSEPRGAGEWSEPDSGATFAGIRKRRRPGCPRSVLTNLRRICLPPSPWPIALQPGDSGSMPGRNLFSLQRCAVISYRDADLRGTPSREL